MTSAQILALGAVGWPRLITASDNNLTYQIAKNQAGSTAVVLSTTPAALVAAAAAMTQEQKQSLLPESIQVDYIATSNQAGYAIPAGAYSQKNGVPYFGNSPINAERLPVKYLSAGLQDTTTGFEKVNRSLCSFDITPGFGYVRIDLDLTVIYTSGSAPLIGNNVLAFLSDAEMAAYESSGVFAGGAVGIDIGSFVSSQRNVTIQGGLHVDIQDGSTDLWEGSLVRHSSTGLGVAPARTSGKMVYNDEYYALGEINTHLTTKIHVAVVAFSAFPPMVIRGKVAFGRISHEAS